MAAKKVVPPVLDKQKKPWDWTLLETDRNRLLAENDDMRRAIVPLRDDYKAANKKVEDLEAKLAAAEARVTAAEARPNRRKLPDERKAQTRIFRVRGKDADVRLYLTLGFYEDGSLGEIFIRADKVGSFVSGILDGFAIAVSLGLQHGVPVEAYVRKLIGMRFEPVGFTGDEAYPLVSSILDYVGRWLKKRFVKEEEQ